MSDGKPGMFARIGTTADIYSRSPQAADVYASATRPDANVGDRATVYGGWLSGIVVAPDSDGGFLAGFLKRF